MFFIPGKLIALLTFPGVIVHEWAHEVFCKMFGVKVHKVVYFQFANPSGYVLHEAPTLYKQTFWISIGPLLVNSLATVLLSFIATQTVSGGWVWCILLWLAFSIGLHSFPSDQDMQHISSASKSALKNGGHFLHYLAFPFVWLVWIANKLRFIWFDAIYAVLLMALGGGFTAITADSATTSLNNTSGQVTVGQYSCSSYAASEADSIQPSQNTSNQLDLESSNLDRLSNTVDNDPVDQTSQTDIDRHNELVQDYNTELDSYKSQLATYNSQVDSYNAYLQQNCTPN